MNLIKKLFLLIVSPGNGWSEIKKFNIPKDKLLSNLFYPLLAIVAITTFVSFFYGDTSTLIEFLQKAIINVGVFFFGYMISSYFLLSFYPKICEEKTGSNKIHTFVIYNYSILLLILIINNLMPIEFPLIKFLPLYDIFIIWKGRRFFKQDIPEGNFIVTFTFSIMLPFVLLRLIFSSLISLY